MSKDYDVDDILSEIKAKKKKQNSSAQSSAKETLRKKIEPGQPESDFKIDRKEQFAKMPQQNYSAPARPFKTPEPEPIPIQEEPEPQEALFQDIIPRREVPRGNPPKGGSTPFFSGYDAPDESMFRPEKKRIDESVQTLFTGISSPNVLQDQDLFDDSQHDFIHEETDSLLHKLSKKDPDIFSPKSSRTVENPQPQQVQKEAPKAQSTATDHTLEQDKDNNMGFFTGSFFVDSLSFEADEIETATTEHEYSKEFTVNDTYETTLFDKQIPEDPQSTPFKVTLPPDAMSEDSQSHKQATRTKIPEKETLLFGEDLPPTGKSANKDGEGKHKGLFSRNRKHAEITIEDSDHGDGVYSRLMNSEVPVPEDTDTETEELEDYNSPKDKEAILHDMRSIKTGLILRLVLLTVVFAVSFYVSLAARDIKVGEFLLPLPDFMQPETHIRSYMIVSTLLSALAAIICSNTVGGGLISLFQFKANTDALPALSVIGTMAQGICYIVRPVLFSTDKGDFGSNLYLFFPVAIFILMFNIIGKLMVILRIQNNFKLVVSERTKHATSFLKDKRLLRELTKGLSMEEYTIAYSEEVKVLAGFLDQSYAEDHAEGMSRVLAPLCLLAGVLLSVISYFFNKDVAVAITTFTAVMCISAPLTSTIAANLPMLRLSTTLIPIGAMVSGYSAIETFARTEAVVMNACDVFRPENVVLHGIKAFDQGKIDTVILDAASVVCTTNGMLTEVFSKIIGENKAMLKPVESIAYEDSMGLSAWVDGKRVLIGNRELMLNHGVDVPSNDYEMRYVKDSKNIIYLSNSGTLSAMFVISYNPSSDVKEELDKLADKGMYLIVETSDPNITAEKVRDSYEFPMEQIRLLPAKLHKEYLNLTKEKERGPARLGFIGSSKSMVRAIMACMKAKSAVEQSVLIQMVALVVGYGLVALFSLMGNLNLLSVVHLLLFQGIWGLIATVIPNLKSY